MAQSVVLTGPRSSVTPPLTSVNQAPRKWVGSRASCQVAPGPARHQARARAWNAATDGASFTQPPDGPAPIPTPQFAFHHNASPIPWAAAVQPPSVRLVPTLNPSAPCLLRHNRRLVVAPPTAHTTSRQDT